jgi:hypothetical protein
MEVVQSFDEHQQNKPVESTSHEAMEINQSDNNIMNEEYCTDEEDDNEDESDYNITVFSARPGNFHNYITTGKTECPTKSFKISIGMTADTIDYMGPVFQNLVATSESNYIELTTNCNVDYKDNLLYLLKFIETVSSKYSDEEHKQISEYSNVYHKINASCPLLVNVIKNSTKFARANCLFPNKGKQVNINHVQKVHDFGCLCEYLQIDIGILAASYWFKTLSRLSNPMQINDILDLPPSSHEDNVYRAKRVIYFLKYPFCILEPSRKLLDNINVEIDEHSDINYQIEYIKEQFIDKQRKRFYRFNEELTEINHKISNQDILQMASKTNYINEDDMRKIEYEFDKKRYISFHEDVLTKENELNRKLTKPEFKEIKDISPHLRIDEKQSTNGVDNTFIFSYQMIVKEYEQTINEQNILKNT